MNMRSHGQPEKMPDLTSANSISRLLAACVAVVLISGCEAKSPPPAATTQISTIPDTRAIKQFDALTTPTTIFPDPAQRALYEMQAPSTDNGRRSYTFELKAQPGMKANRHFHLITITWAPAGSFGGTKGAPRIKSTFGPGGSIIDAAAQTADGRFDVQVSEAMLLPDTVPVPPFDLTVAAASLARGYVPDRVR